MKIAGKCQNTSRLPRVSKLVPMEASSVYGCCGSRYARLVILGKQRKTQRTVKRHVVVDTWKLDPARKESDEREELLIDGTTSCATRSILFIMARYKVQHG